MLQVLRPRAPYLYAIQVIRLLSWPKDDASQGSVSSVTNQYAGVSESGATIARKILWFVIVGEGTEYCYCLYDYPRTFSFRHLLTTEGAS